MYLPSNQYYYKNQSILDEIEKGILIAFWNGYFRRYELCLWCTSDVTVIKRIYYIKQSQDTQQLVSQKPLLTYALQASLNIILNATSKDHALSGRLG